MHQFRRTTAMLATAFAVSLTGCAMMDFAQETPSDDPQLSDIKVKIPGTWWDSKRVKLDEVAATRKQKLEQEAQATTPYATAATKDLAKTKSPIVPPGPPVPLSGGGLVFRDVLADGAPLTDVQPGNDSKAAAPVTTSVAVPPPSIVEPVQQAVYQVPARHESSTVGEGERAPPLPNTVARPSKLPTTAPVQVTRESVATASKTPKPRLQGVVRGAKGGMVAMVEIPGGGTQMARVGDTMILADENGQMQAFQVKHIANQQVLMHSETNQAMVIQ